MSTDAIVVVEVVALYVSFSLAATAALMDRNGRFRLSVDEWLSVIFWPCALVVGVFKKLLP